MRTLVRLAAAVALISSLILATGGAAYGWGACVSGPSGSFSTPGQNDTSCASDGSSLAIGISIGSATADAEAYENSGALAIGIDDALMPEENGDAATAVNGNTGGNAWADASGTSAAVAVGVNVGNQVAVDSESPGAQNGSGSGNASADASNTGAASAIGINIGSNGATGNANADASNGTANALAAVIGDGNSAGGHPRRAGISRGLRGVPELRSFAPPRVR